MSTENSSEYKCEKCGEVFTSERELNEHIEAHIRAAELFECETCKITFQNKEKLLEHIEKAHKKRVNG